MRPPSSGRTPACALESARGVRRSAGGDRAACRTGSPRVRGRLPLRHADHRGRAAGHRFRREAMDSRPTLDLQRRRAPAAVCGRIRGMRSGPLQAPDDEVSSLRRPWPNRPDARRRTHAAPLRLVSGTVRAWPLSNAASPANRPGSITSESTSWSLRTASGELTIGDSHEYGDAIEPFDKSEIDEWILGYLGTFLELTQAADRIDDGTGLMSSIQSEPYMMIHPVPA